VLYYLNDSALAENFEDLTLSERAIAKPYVDDLSVPTELMSLTLTWGT